MKQMLFIGGPWNGCWVEVDDGLQVLHVAEAERPRVGDTFLDAPLEAAVRRTMYRKEMIATGSGSGVGSTFTFWVHEKLTPADAIGMLIHGYRPAI